MSAGTVCLTFDFDAVSLWVSRGMRTPAPVSRGEFGPVAVPRILELLGARSIPTTWFIPGHTIETYPEVCQEVVDAGHEVALHGYAHENVALLREGEEREERVVRSGHRGAAKRGSAVRLIGSWAARSTR